MDQGEQPSGPSQHQYGGRLFRAPMRLSIPTRLCNSFEYERINAETATKTLVGSKGT